MARSTGPEHHEPKRPLSWRAVRRRCDDLLATVAVPEPFDLYKFVSAVGGERGRAIRVVELPNEGAVDAPPQGARSVCGLVVQLASEDVVFVEPRDWVYRVHVGLHELAHLVCRHQGDEPSLAHLSLFPDLDPSMVRAAFGRTRYSESQEMEAEAMATILTERLIGRDTRSGRDGAKGIAQRIERTLGTS